MHDSNEYTTHHITAKDGTQLGYESTGSGPNVLLIQGTMGSIENFRQLADKLSSHFTVHIADRRGRGISGASGDNYSLQTEVDDFNSLVAATQSERVFALSSGAIIALRAVLQSNTVTRLAIFEPPLMTCESIPMKLIDQYEAEIKQGNIASALVTAMKAGQFGPKLLNYLPNWMLTGFVNHIIKAEKKAGSGNYVSMEAIAPTIHNDFQVIIESLDTFADYKEINVKTLLMRGAKSPQYLQDASDSIQEAIPHIETQLFPNLGHSAAWNYDKQRNPSGEPAVIAERLISFFES